MAAKLTLVEKLKRKQARRIDKMTWTTAGMVAERDMKNGVPYNTRLETYDDPELKKIVETLYYDDSVNNLHVPRTATKKYIDLCTGRNE